MIRLGIAAFLNLTLILAAAVFGGNEAIAADCSRIVSLSPSVTETLFAVGLGDNVVGVSRYDKYPEAVLALPKIGGFLDPNYEVVLSLNPTLVVGLSEQRDQLNFIERINRKTLTLNHKSIAGILESIAEVGRVCDRSAEATKLVSSLNTQILSMREKSSVLPKKKVMIVVGGDGDSLKSLYISGKDGYFSEILEIAGGLNVYSGDTQALPGISREGIMHFSPDVIVEVAYNPTGAVKTGSKMWDDLSGVSAVDNHQVYLITADYASIPGPRFINTIKDFFVVLHPEANGAGN